MINTDSRYYSYFTFGDDNGYGQPSLSEEAQGLIKMAINITSQAIADNNIKYKDATYLGLTMENIDDTYVIQYGNEKLKVLYVNPRGRFKQVFMSEL